MMVNKIASLRRFCSRNLVGWGGKASLGKREFIGGFINLLLNIQKCIFAKSLFYERRMHYLQSASGVSE